MILTFLFIKIFAQTIIIQEVYLNQCFCQHQLLLCVFFNIETFLTCNIQYFVTHIYEYEYIYTKVERRSSMFDNKVKKCKVIEKVHSFMQSKPMSTNLVIVANFIAKTLRLRMGRLILYILSSPKLMRQYRPLHSFTDKLINTLPRYVERLVQSVLYR